MKNFIQGLFQRNHLIRLPHVAGAFVLFAVVTAVLMTPLTPAGQYLLKNVSQPQNPLPDLRFTYSAGEFYQCLELLGDAGRKDYIRNLLTLDVLFPLAHTGFLALLLAYIIRLAGPRQRLWLLWALLPLAGCAADFLENLLEVVLTLAYPRRWYTLAALTGYVTALKHTLLNLSWLSVPAALLWLAISRLRRVMKPAAESSGTAAGGK